VFFKSGGLSEVVEGRGQCRLLCGLSVCVSVCLSVLFLLDTVFLTNVVVVVVVVFGRPMWSVRGFFVCE